MFFLFNMLHHMSLLLLPTTAKHAEFTPCIFLPPTYIMREEGFKSLSTTALVAGF
jgi:hypothetical protein